MRSIAVLTSLVRAAKTDDFNTFFLNRLMKKKHEKIKL